MQNISNLPIELKRTLILSYRSTAEVLKGLYEEESIKYVKDALRITIKCLEIKIKRLVENIPTMSEKDSAVEKVAAFVDYQNNN